MDNFIHNLPDVGLDGRQFPIFPQKKKTAPHSMLPQGAVIHYPSRFRMSVFISHPLKKRYEEQKTKK
jgi:hypothetical protein